MDKAQEPGKTTKEACCAPSCCAPETAATPAQTDLREVVKEKYGNAVKAVMKGAAPSCCGSSAKQLPLGMETDPITRDLYASDETAGLPAEALLASFGCGNPMALAELRPGEVVLDLGSGGGIDVLLSARRVGPTGKAYGLAQYPDGNFVPDDSPWSGSLQRMVDAGKKIGRPLRGLQIVAGLQIEPKLS